MLLIYFIKKFIQLEIYTNSIGIFSLFVWNLDAKVKKEQFSIFFSDTKSGDYELAYTASRYVEEVSAEFPPPGELFLRNLL